MSKIALFFTSTMVGALLVGCDKKTNPTAPTASGGSTTKENVAVSPASQPAASTLTPQLSRSNGRNTSNAARATAEAPSVEPLREVIARSAEQLIRQAKELAAPAHDDPKSAIVAANIEAAEQGNFEARCTVGTEARNDAKIEQWVGTREMEKALLSLANRLKKQGNTAASKLAADTVAADQSVVDGLAQEQEIPDIEQNFYDAHFRDGGSQVMTEGHRGYDHSLADSLYGRPVRTAYPNSLAIEGQAGRKKWAAIKLAADKLAADKLGAAIAEAAGKK